MKKIRIILMFSIISILIFFCIKVFFSTQYIQTNSKETIGKIDLKINKNPLNIDEILNENTKDIIKEELVVEEIDLDYNTIYTENEDLPSGTIHITQMGINGKQDTIIIKRYKNDELFSEEIVANNISKASINKLVEIGTGNGKNNYKIRENDNVYVTPSVLNVMESPDLNSQKIDILLQGEMIQIDKIYNNIWCYITSNDGNGYVLIEGLSNINPIRNENGDYDLDEFTKTELLEKLNINMDVSVPSGLTLEQFRKILQYNSKDKNNIFTNNADYFYYAEQSYGINGVFLAAIAIHESSYGTSKIAINKNNLFGYMSYDSSPYLSSKTFGSYSEGIDLVARVLIKYYLNENGEEIYGGEIADGRYYSGKTIKSVNKFYATDTNWTNCVYAQMKALYESL